MTIQVLDVNDNVPSIAGGGDDIIVCQSTKNGQVGVCNASSEDISTVKFCNIKLELLKRRVTAVCMTCSLEE